MDSSPNSSPSTSRFFSTFPTGPPQRTYSKRKPGNLQARSKADEQLPGQTDDDEIVVSPSSQRRPKLKSDSRSSPTPASRRAPSRLASSSSQSGTQSKGTSPSRRNRVRSPDELEQQRVGSKEVIAAGRSLVRKGESMAAIDGMDGRAIEGPLERKRKRVVRPSVGPLSPRRSPRSRSNSAAVVATIEDTDRPCTPPPDNQNATGRRGPRTPPRSIRPTLPTTPSSSSPRDFAGLFAAVSPGVADHSPFASPRAARILGKSQSSGAVLDSPSKLRQRLESVQRQDYFGSNMSAGPSTPLKRLGQTQSMPLTPSHSSPIILETDHDPSAILGVQSNVPEGQGSGGRAKRVYGRTRTIVAEEREGSQDPQSLEETLGKESYADLRRRYEVDSGSAGISADLLSVCRLHTARGEARLIIKGLVAARPPEPINDMRSKGENRRYMDETGYLLDGIVEAGASKGFRKSRSVMRAESVILRADIAALSIY